MRGHHRRTRTGFTLIELLVVIGIIALLSSLVGLGLNSGRDAHALRAARGLLAAQLHAARGQATLRRRPVALAVVGDPADASNYLRQLFVAVNTTGATWAVAQDAVSLPAGLRVYPPGQGSTLFAPETVPVSVPAGAGLVMVPCYLVSFSAAGTLQVGGGGTLRLGFGESVGGGWFFDAGRESTEIQLSRYGAISETAVAP